MKLRLKLCFDELLELTSAAGFSLQTSRDYVDCDLEKFEHFDLIPDQDIDLEEIIDGCVDLIYVATGFLLACGVPDAPHLAHVCERNDAKLVDGKAIVSKSGRYEKPPGWVAPDHLGKCRETAFTYMRDQPAELANIKLRGMSLAVMAAIEATNKRLDEYLSSQTRRLRDLEEAAVSLYRRTLMENLRGVIYQDVEATDRSAEPAGERKDQSPDLLGLGM
jgi:hypothetical protein